MKRVFHDQLWLEQKGMGVLVHIRGAYHNEHIQYLFIEVLGEVTRNDSQVTFAHCI